MRAGIIKLECEFSMSVSNMTSVRRRSLVLPEDEDVEDRQVERKAQCELYDHQPGQDVVCDLTGCFAVVYFAGDV